MKRGGGGARTGCERGGEVRGRVVKGGAGVRAGCCERGGQV